VSNISQRAVIAALTGPQDSVEQMRRAFDRRRRLIVAELGSIPGVTLHLTATGGERLGVLAEAMQPWPVPRNVLALLVDGEVWATVPVLARFEGSELTIPAELSDADISAMAKALVAE
jgi:hypothetical protein